MSRSHERTQTLGSLYIKRLPNPDKTGSFVYADPSAQPTTDISRALVWTETKGGSFEAFPNRNTDLAAVLKYNFVPIAQAIREDS